MVVVICPSLGARYRALYIRLQAIKKRADINEQVMSNLLAEIAASVSAMSAAEAIVDELVDKRDDLIRAAMRAGLPRSDIAQAAGLKVARLYQVRDRRR